MLNFHNDFVWGSLSDESREARRRAVLKETTVDCKFRFFWKIRVVRKRNYLKYRSTNHGIHVQLNSKSGKFEKAQKFQELHRFFWKSVEPPGLRHNCRWSNIYPPSWLWNLKFNWSPPSDVTGEFCLPNETCRRSSGDFIQASSTRSFEMVLDSFKDENNCKSDKSESPRGKGKKTPKIFTCQEVEAKSCRRNFKSTSSEY